MTHTILVIEDEASIRENLTELLELAGYKVLSAKNGVEGIKAARLNKPNLILCDVMMPEMDGYGVLHTLLKDEELMHTPFIYLTAKAGIEDLRRGMRIGADDYITKPYEASDLLSSIEMRLAKNAHLKDKYAADMSGLENLLEDTKGALDLESVLQNAVTIKFKKKDAIYRAGSIPREVYYLKKGSVKSVKYNDDGKELITEVWRDKDFFGVIAAINETAYTHAAVAAEDSELVSIPMDEFKKLMDVNAEIANRFIRIFAGNIEEKENELLEIAYGSIRTRLADALVKLGERYADKLVDGIPMSREELAQFVGTTSETVIRTLKDFKEEGLVSVNKSRVIPHTDKLQAMKY